MRKLLKSRSGFTLVELMVVVVVLGILAGIAVQRMGDVRDRAETAAREANTRLLLGAANLALTRNYGDYMIYDTRDPEDIPADATSKRNAVIRWQRPCEKPAVTQLLAQTQGAGLGHSYSGYGHIENHSTATGTMDHLEWNPGQEWNLTDYLESFPIGYAVEIVFAARDNENNIVSRNARAYAIGYHQDGGTQTTGAELVPGNPYNQDQIIIYKFIDDEAPSDAWSDFGTAFEPTGIQLHDAGVNYPYHNITTGTQNEHALTRDHWREVFPVNRYSN